MPKQKERWSWGLHPKEKGETRSLWDILLRPFKKKGRGPN